MGLFNTMTSTVKSSWDGLFFTARDGLSAAQVKKSKYEQAHNNTVLRTARGYQQTVQLATAAFIGRCLTSCDEASMTGSLLALTIAVGTGKYALDAAEALLAASPLYTPQPEVSSASMS